MVITEAQGEAARGRLGDGGAAQAALYKIGGGFGRDRTQARCLGSEAVEPGGGEAVLEDRAPDVFIQTDERDRAGHLFADPVDNLGDVHAGVFRSEKAVKAVSHDHDRAIIRRDAEELHETFAGFAVGETAKPVEGTFVPEIQVNEDTGPESEFRLPHSEVAGKVGVGEAGKIVRTLVDPREDLRVRLPGEEGSKVGSHPCRALGTLALLYRATRQRIEDEAGKKKSRDFLNERDGVAPRSVCPGELTQHRRECDRPGNGARAIKRENHCRGDGAEMIPQPGNEM